MLIGCSFTILFTGAKRPKPLPAWWYTQSTPWRHGFHGCLAQSSDLHSTEHLWDKLECSLHPRLSHQKWMPELTNALVGEWMDESPQQDLGKSFQTFGVETGTPAGVPRNPRGLTQPSAVRDKIWVNACAGSKILVCVALPQNRNI